MAATPGKRPYVGLPTADRRNDRYDGVWGTLSLPASVGRGVPMARGGDPIGADILQFGCDTCAYLWSRDGELVAHALVHAGYGQVMRRFFEFCARVLSKEPQ